MNSNKFLIFIILILSGFIFASCSEPSQSIAVGNLQIIYSSNSSLETIASRKDWKPIINPLYINGSNLSFNDYTQIWIKGEFTITGDPAVYSGIYLKSGLMTETVYLNNVFIGKKPIGRIVDLIMPGQYPVESTLLKTGKNVVYIHMGIPPMTNVNFSSYMRIQSKNDFEKTKSRNYLLYYQGLIAMIIIISSFIVMQVINYFFDRKTRTRLIYLSGLIAGIIVLSILLVRFDKIDMGLLLTFLYACVPPGFIYLMFLIQSMYGIFLLHINRAAFVVMIIFTMAICLLNGHILIQTIVLSSAIIMIVGCAVYLLHCLHRIKANKILLPFIIGGVAIMIISIFLQIFIPHFDIYYPRFANMYQFLLYLLAAIIYEAFDTRKKRIKIDRLYTTLKQTKSQAKSQAKATLTITDSSREKLEIIKTFIHKNYTSDISREGLASAVDINPNYLSTLFKAYTGKKINEYINSIRIKEAAKQLVNTDKKIIDIAFSTGFENLATFIRIFKNEMETTPSQYRKNMKIK